MFPGMLPVFLPCAISPARSTCFIPTGCTCSPPTAICRRWTTRRTSSSTWCKTIARVPSTTVSCHLSRRKTPAWKIRAAFYVPWDAASFSSLRDFARQIDLLYPDWLHVLTPDGHLQAVDDQTNKFFDVVQNNRARSVEERVMPFIKAEDSSMEVFPMVNNFNGTDWVGGIAAFLNDPDARGVFRKQVSLFLSSDRFDGLMVDFEAFPSSGQKGYVALLNELSSDLHARGMKLYVSVPAHNEEFDYAAISAPADGVIVMNYDEHYPGAAAGPVASQDWFVDNLKFAVNVIPREKLICAIANYGYDWVLKPKKGKSVD